MDRGPGFRRVLIFTIGAFAFAWLLWMLAWLAASRGVDGIALMALVIGGSFAPFVAAGFCTVKDGGWRGMLRFYARVLDPRLGWLVFSIAVLLLPMLGIGAAALHAHLHGQAFSFQLGWSDLPMTYLWLFLLGGPVAEEFGWSYLSDALDQHLSIKGSTLALGVIWALWHLPLFYLDVPGLAQRFIPFWLFGCLSIAARFLFSWAYHRSGRNILSNLVFHNGLNLSLSIVVIVEPVVGGSLDRLAYLIGGAAICAVLLWYFAPPEAIRGGHRIKPSQP
jgi:hypothetical protein